MKLFNKKIILALLVFGLFPTTVMAKEDGDDLSKEDSKENLSGEDLNQEEAGKINEDPDTGSLKETITANEESLMSNGELPPIYYDSYNLDEIITRSGFNYDENRVILRKKALEEGREVPVFPNDYKKQLEEARESELEEARKEAQKSYEEKKKADQEQRRKEEEKIREDNFSKKDPVAPLPKSDLYPKVPVYENVIDMSVHQSPGAIDYDKLANVIDGAILRSSIRNKDLVNRKDKEVERHYYELNKRGVPIGFYHYSRAITEEEAIAEANFVLDIIKNKKVSLPVYIDIEDHDRQLKATKNQISKVADAFCKAIRRNGYVAGIYSYPWFAEEYLTKEVRDKNEFWIAEWKKDQTYPKYNKSHYDSWQYSSHGGLYGYKYDLDKNVLYRDYPLIMTGVSHKGFERVADEVIDGKWGNGLVRYERLKYAGYDPDLIQAYVNKSIKARKI